MSSIERATNSWCEEKEATNDRRIYMEYCEHGTLHDLISAYQDLALRNVTTYDGDEIDW